jgi:hypothetical protein
MATNAPKQQSESEYVTTRALADMLGLPVRTVQISYKTWGLVPIRLGKFLMFNRAEVRAFMEDHRVTA